MVNRIGRPAEPSPTVRTPKESLVVAPVSSVREANTFRRRTRAWADRSAILNCMTSVSSIRVRAAQYEVHAEHDRSLEQDSSAEDQ